MEDVRSFKRDRIHEGRDPPGGQVLPDQPLGAIPVEPSGGMTNAGEVHTGWGDRIHALAPMHAPVGQ